MLTSKLICRDVELSGICCGVRTAVLAHDIGARLEVAHQQRSLPASMM